MTKKIWNLVYAIGTTGRIVGDADNPLSKDIALEGAATVEKNGWRVWVEHHTSGKRIFESKQEIAHQAAQAKGSSSVASLATVDDAYRRHPLNFAVYGKHCFAVVPGNVRDSEPVGSIRLSRGGWTPVANIGEARVAYGEFMSLCDEWGIPPGGLGLVANAEGVITHMVYPAGVIAVKHLGRTGELVTDKPATVDLFSIAADEADEGERYVECEPDRWALDYGKSRNNLQASGKRRQP